jgi:hypothetical protein
MQYWKTAFLTLLIFGLGGVAGGLVTAQVIKRKIEVVRQTTPGPDVVAPEWIPQTVQVMRRQLNLRPDQVERARDIMLSSQREIVRQREEFRLHSRNAIARADDAIYEILSDEQKPLFEEFKQRRAAKWKQRLQNDLPVRPLDRPDMRRDGPPFGPNRPQGDFRQPGSPPPGQRPQQPQNPPSQQPVPTPANPPGQPPSPP